MEIKEGANTLRTLNYTWLPLPVGNVVASLTTVLNDTGQQSSVSYTPS